MSQIYHASISLFQKEKCTSGKKFETIIEAMLEKAKIPFQRQVHIDSKGSIYQKCKNTKNIPDIVIGNVVKGSNISDYIIISCKKTCRERWKQDGWFISHQPKLFILATQSSDYPSSDNFEESEKRKIATSKPKVSDLRKYKLDLTDIVEEIQKIIR